MSKAHISGCQCKVERCLTADEVKKAQDLGCTVVKVSDGVLLSFPMEVSILDVVKKNDIIGPLSDMESILLNKKRNLGGCTNGECGVFSCEGC